MLKADLSRVHKHRVWTIGGAGVAVAIATIVLAAAGSMRTPNDSSIVRQQDPAC